MFDVTDHLRIGPSDLRRVPDEFPLRPYGLLELAPLSPCIGAEVRGFDLSTTPDEATLGELRQALLEWKVLFFRDQAITREQQREFALLWGTAEQHPFFDLMRRDQDDARVVRIARDGAFGGSENEWHADVTWRECPSFGAVLRAVELPPSGGDTLWADAGAVYDGLPEELRESIDTMSAEHDWRSTFGLAMSDEERERLGAQFPPVEHPVVRLHPETGRRTLFVNPFFTQRIIGLDHDKSSRLLSRLYREFTRPEYQCRFRWTPGSVAFWDNRSTQHYAVSDYSPHRRVMDRISIAGDLPHGPAGDRPYGAEDHPRGSVGDCPPGP